MSKNMRRGINASMKNVIRKLLINPDVRGLDDDERVALNWCVEKQYITGVQASVTISGRVIIKAVSGGAIRLTPEGANFLFPKRNKELIITTTVAIISLCLNVIQLLLAP